MGKKGRPSTKPSPLSYGPVARTMRELRQLAAPDYMPYHLEILEPIIAALTERIKTLLPDDYLLWRLIVPVPREREHLVAIVRVMLDRIKVENPDEYNYCRGRVAEIATLEAAHTMMPTEERWLGVNTAVQQLIHDAAPTCQHSVDNVTLQYSVLIDFLSQHEYPTAKTDDHKRKDWLKARWADMMTMLTEIPCRCSYSQDHHQFIDVWLNDRFDQYEFQLLSGTAYLILAYLHNTEPQFVQRKLVIS